MKAALHRWEAVSQLVGRLSAEPRERLFHEVVDLLLASTPAGAALILDASSGSLEPVAERGLVFGSTHAARVIRESLLELAQRALADHHTIAIAAVARELPQAVAGDLFSAAYASALIAPAELAGEPFAALLLLFDARAEVDAETTAFVTALGSILAVALQRKQRAANEQCQSAVIEHASRMAGLGHVTTSLAHDLGSPAGALVLQLEQQRRILSQLERLSLGGDTEVAELVSELVEVTCDVEAAVCRIRATAAQLSSLTLPDAEPDEVDLSEIVRAALAVARPALERRGLSLVQEVAPRCLISGRREALGQLALNLVFNAADACEAGMLRPGRVTVRLLERDQLIALEVEDTGPGVPDGASAAISAGAWGLGKIGLGLRVCSDVISAHSGQSEVVSPSGGGACFRALLPRLESESGIHPVFPAQAGPGVRRARPRQSILLIDDDPVFTRTLRRTLKAHDVTTASTASEAEIVLIDRRYQPDLILCDVCLPGSNGDALHSRIVELRPELAARFVFVTGGGLAQRETEYLERVGCPVLLKPVSEAQILDALSSNPQPLPTRRLAGGAAPGGDG